MKRVSSSSEEACKVFVVEMIGGCAIICYTPTSYPFIVGILGGYTYHTLSSAIITIGG